MSDDLRRFLTYARQSQTHANIAKLLSAVERAGTSAYEIDELLQPQRLAFRVGITGPPGAGKSTLIGQLLEQFKKSKKRIGVIAIDPTSPVSSGALLGDRIRYSHQVNDQIFIRSLGTRGAIGGLAAHAYLLARAFDACEFDIVIVETVGVGQVEIDVMNVADIVVLVLVPESGDSIQVMKAGITEIADAVVVNKSDRPGAESLRREIESQFALGRLVAKNGGQVQVPPPVLSISATQNEGVDKLIEWLEQETVKPWQTKRYLPKRLQAEATALKRDQIESEMRRLVDQIETPNDVKVLFSHQNRASK